MKIIIRQTALILSLLLIITFVIPTNVLGATVQNDSKTVIKLFAGSDKLNVNGQILTVQKPYNSGKAIYIPLRAVLESLGAEVDWLGSGNMKILFKNISIDLTVGKVKYAKNQTEETLQVPPVMTGGSVMIPADMISKCFDIDVSSNEKTGETIITMNNDGSLTDLSFLTGSIDQQKAGNSYFGWSISIPKGSRVTSQTFNSKNIVLENEHRAISIDISTDMNNGMTLDKYYEKITGDPNTILKADLIDSNLNMKASPAYMELYYTDSYDEAVYQRIYADNKYFYNITITSYNESNPDVLKKDKYFTDIMNSFKLGYTGNREDTIDLSSVKYGLAKYDNYITSSDTGKKYYSWEMSVLPEWDIMPPQGDNPYITQFGTGHKEYVSIETTPVKDITNIETYGKDIKSTYDSNFNPALYKLEKAELSKVAGNDAYNMVYNVKLGKSQYRYDERFLISGRLVYDITFKALTDNFEAKKESYYKMLDTFIPSDKDAQNLSSEMEKYIFTRDKNRIGKDDKPVVYENKTFGWNASFPGCWQKNSTPGQNLESFNDPKTGAVIMIEAIAKKAGNTNTADNEKFDSMKMVASMNLEPVKTDTIQAKGKTTKTYKYRLDDDESDTFADIDYYVIDSDAYSYCFMSTIPDLSATDGNVKSLDDIWNSFTLLNAPAGK